MSPGRAVSCDRPVVSCDHSTAVKIDLVTRRALIFGSFPELSHYATPDGVMCGCNN